MNLVSALCSGIAGAANGWAEIYVRGTMVRATVYYDFEKSTSDSSGDNIELDAYGAVEVYVNQLVDIVAKSPDGTVIRSWTDGYSSPNVEVISPAFTGNDYVSGAAAINKPTTLQSVLDRWLDSAGSIDWKVLIGGVGTSMKDAIGTLYGLVINVKSPAYGATGDGVTNDQAAIQAALAAAVAAGGGTLFFPKGTYLVSTAIEWDHRVNMLGIGSGLSVITTNSATNAQIIKLTAGTAPNQPLTFVGMAFAASQANNGTQIFASVKVVAEFINCWFCASTNATGIGTNFSVGDSRLTFRDCLYWINGSTNYAATTSATAYTAYLRCYFVTTGASGPPVLLQANGASDLIDGCIFDYTSLTNPGVNNAVRQASTGTLTVTNCSFIPLGQTLDFVLAVLGDDVTCVNNSFSFQVQGTWYDILGQLSGASEIQRGYSISLSTAAPSITTGTRFCAHTSNTTVPTFSMPTGAYPGQELTITLTNTSGAGWLSVGFTPSIQRVTTLTAVDVPNAATVALKLVWAGTFWLLYHKA